MDFVPDDIWEIILGKLSLQDRGRTSSVCKEWYKRCWSHLRQFSFSFRHRPRQDFIIISILKRATKLRHLQLIDCFNVTGQIVAHFPSSLVSFEYLNCPLIGKQLFDQHLQNLPPGLISIKLYQCGLISHKGIERFPATLRELEMTETVLDDPAIPCLPRNLLSLSLSSCKMKLVNSLSTLPPHLTYLDISCTQNLKDEALESLPETIRTLNLGYSKEITDHGLLYIAALKSLKVLNLEACPKITGEMSFFELPSSLETLILRESGVTDQGILAIPRKSILELDIRDCKNLSNVSLTQLPVTIESLTLSRLLVTNETLVGLPAQGLKSLTLFGCNVTDAMVKLIPPDTLEMLDLSRTSITNATLDYISQNFQVLKKLILARCTVSADSILLLQNCRPNLKILRGTVQ